jgi:hypothetical protein
MLRRALVLALLLPVALGLSACGSAEGRRAQDLLAQAQAAEANLRSATFDGAMSFTLSGRKVEILFEGAGSRRGQYVSMRSHGIPGSDVDMRLVVRGDRAWLRMNGVWQSTAVPTDLGRAAKSASLGSAAFRELTKYVKDVRVNEHQVVNGEPAAIIAGELDTAGLVRSFAKLASLSDLGASNGFDLGDLDAVLGDIRAVLTVSERTHLLTSALLQLTVEAAGERVELRLSYRLTSANRPVEIPTPA